MKKVKISSEVRDGRLVRNRSMLDKAVKSFEGESVSMTIEKEKKTRSTSQNRYYWGVVVKLISEGLTESWGEVVTSDLTHEFLKTNFSFEEIVNEETGEIYKKIISTADTGTSVFMDYIENCKQFAMSYLNVNIPDPDEQLSIV